MKVDYYKYKEQDFTCPHCKWNGKGSELKNGEFSEMHFIGELDCPVCHERVAFWQAPLVDKEKQETTEITEIKNANDLSDQLKRLHNERDNRKKKVQRKSINYQRKASHSEQNKLKMSYLRM
jgi:hypothetical protein